MYDALPTHQFELRSIGGDMVWCERVINLSFDNKLRVETTDYATEAVKKVLQPEKFFSKEAYSDLKEGDRIEVCPQAIKTT